MAKRMKEIIPVEAKSSINLKAKSLQVYRSYYKPRFDLPKFLGL
jgi:hypothetical protein